MARTRTKGQRATTGGSRKLAGGITLDEIRHAFEMAVAADAPGRPRAEEDAHVLANDQWSEPEKIEFKKRKQQPLVMNQIHQDYYMQLGRQIKNRMDPCVLPRGDSSEEVAAGLTDLIRFLLDENEWDYVLTDAVKDQLIVRGWIKVSYQREDMTKEPISIVAIPWRNMRVDPAGRHRGLKDYKNIHEERWVDLDDAVALYEGQKSTLEHLAGPQGPSQDAPLPSFETRGYDPYKAAIQRGDVGHQDYMDADRKRVRLVESWYRRSEEAFFMLYPDGHVELFDEDAPKDRHLAELFPEPKADPLSGLPINTTSKPTLVKGPHQAYYYVIWSGDKVIQEGKSKYEHGMYPYVKLDAYVADVTTRTGDLAPNEPYGMIRIAKDPQKLFNAAMSKVRHILASRQVVMGKGVADRSHVEANAANPAGIIELDKPDGRFEFVDQIAQASGLKEVLDRAKDQLQASTGVNEASRGLGPEQSGRAMLARQQQSEISNAMLVDNQRYSIIQVGKMLISMIQQSETAEKIIRITEDAGARVIAINVTDPQRIQELQARFKKKDGTSGITVYGDVTQGGYGLRVDNADATQSRQETDNALMMALLAHLPPEFIVANVDLLIENMQLSNKAKFLKRVREIQAEGQQKPQEPPPRVMDQVTFAPIVLTTSERAQVVQQMGVQPDPNAPPTAQPGSPTAPAPQAPPPPIDPNRVLELDHKDKALASQERIANQTHHVKLEETKIRAASAMADAHANAAGHERQVVEGQQAHGREVLKIQQQAEQAAKAAPTEEGNQQ